MAGESVRDRRDPDTGRMKTTENAGDREKSVGKMNIPDSRVREEIDRGALRDNFLALRELAAPAGVFAVVKANAYGLGVKPVARTLKEVGCAGFCVASFDEAEELLNFGLPVQILGSVFDFELPRAVAAGIILGITGFAEAEKYSSEAVRQGRTLECHFKIDTGMGRLGIRVDEAPEVIRRVLSLPNLNCCGIYSHFSEAETGDGEDSFSAVQIRRFLDLLDSCAAQGIRFAKIHMANSDALRLLENTHRAPFNFVRTGLSMYGAFDDSARTFGLKNTVSLRTLLAAARLLPAGASVGYGRTKILEKDTLVGTVSAGYADGLPLALSNRGRVLYRGRFCPVLGRISMDYTTISLDGFSADEWRAGDIVTLIGRDGDSEIRLEEWSGLKGTHPYDILCSVGGRVKKVYTGGS